MVRFLGKARKTNHIPLFCERSELWSNYKIPIFTNLEDLYKILEINSWQFEI
ncbi:MAG: hypothetical protein U5L45_01925 [Saprospiraceae bacterium]|nr:hypothetical protein [Saprospiraceae bacterium]